MYSVAKCDERLLFGGANGTRSRKLATLRREKSREIEQDVVY